MDLMHRASERYSVRRFENRHLEQNVIHQILACGHIAPTGYSHPEHCLLPLHTAKRPLKEVVIYV